MLFSSQRCFACPFILDSPKTRSTRVNLNLSIALVALFSAFRKSVFKECSQLVRLVLNALGRVTRLFVLGTRSVV
ncbi:hypothetical protein L596_004467 [Steinernema carpocapsae]|uniref:Uncharacterized protein n=1 Tax=Steinernema carpocapsae TaxID=34508 RepID=A0A4U8UX02_STECR|nr:hypothetical protein L596_004467 [Steinernema carpocapsae]